jgi:hypothetical protein
VIAAAWMTPSMSPCAAAVAKASSRARGVAHVRGREGEAPRQLAEALGGVRRPRLGAIERDDRAAALQQVLDQVAAHEPAGARHDRAHASDSR